MRLPLSILAMSLALGVSSAHADFDRWSVVKDDDPFSKGENVMIEYSTSLRSGVAIFCDTAKSWISIRAIPGFVFGPSLEGFEPDMKFAIDGQIIVEATGHTGMAGDNMAVAEVAFSDENSQKFVTAFIASKKQVAIQDGISDQPHLLSARGSTKAGEALKACLDK